MAASTAGVGAAPSSIPFTPAYFVLTQEMREHNVKLYCVKEQYDDTPLGRMLQAIQMGFTEQELETTR